MRQHKFEVFTMAIYFFSLYSSSFIEEEHQLWYYFEMTYLLLGLLDHVRNGYLSENFNKAKAKFLANACLLLIITRLARTFNQTGNKWINEKDIGDVLREFVSISE